MGKGFLDPPLYQADIQVVLSLNLKLFIYQVLVSMHAKPNKPSWNNTPNAACKTFAWAHGFLFLSQDYGRLRAVSYFLLNHDRWRTW